MVDLSFKTTPRGLAWSWSYGSWTTTCAICLSPLTWVQISLRGYNMMW